MEALEAIDGYQLRAGAREDAGLEVVLEHDRDGEREHAAMRLETVRRTDPTRGQEPTHDVITTEPLAHP